MTDPAEVRAALEVAMAAALPQDFVTRWVAIVEVADPDGERVLWIECPDGQTSWDTLGLLRYADHVEAAGIAQDGMPDTDPGL